MPKLKTNMPEKNETAKAGVRRVSSVGGKVDEQCKKGFVEKMSFGPGVEERSSLMGGNSGDEGWRTDVCIEWWDFVISRQAKFLILGKLIPEAGWSVKMTKLSTSELNYYMLPTYAIL